MATAIREQVDRDLGFGTRLAQHAGARLLNRDGSFNVVRTGLPFYRTLSAYHALLTTSWPRFFALIAFAYFATNVVFAGAYLLCGPEALSGTWARSPEDRLLEDFFFSGVVPSFDERIQAKAA